jgi:hypothetical protein
MLQPSSMKFSEGHKSDRIINTFLRNTQADGVTQDRQVFTVKLYNLSPLRA